MAAVNASPNCCPPPEANCCPTTWHRSVHAPAGANGGRDNWHLRSEPFAIGEPMTTDESEHRSKHVAAAAAAANAAAIAAAIAARTAAAADDASAAVLFF